MVQVETVSGCIHMPQLYPSIECLLRKVYDLTDTNYIGVLANPLVIDRNWIKSLSLSELKGIGFGSHWEYYEPYPHEFIPTSYERYAYNASRFGMQLYSMEYLFFKRNLIPLLKSISSLQYAPVHSNINWRYVLFSSLWSAGVSATDLSARSAPIRPYSHGAFPQLSVKDRRAMFSAPVVTGRAVKGWTVFPRLMTEEDLLKTAISVASENRQLTVLLAVDNSKGFSRHWECAARKHLDSFIVVTNDTNIKNQISGHLTVLSSDPLQFISNILKVGIDVAIFSSETIVTADPFQFEENSTIVHFAPNEKMKFLNIKSTFGGQWFFHHLRECQLSKARNALELSRTCFQDVVSALPLAVESTISMLPLFRVLSLSSFLLRERDENAFMVNLAGKEEDRQRLLQKKKWAVC